VIGDRVALGPSVQIYTVGHSLNPLERNRPDSKEFTAPVTIGDDVWIGGGAILLPGVSIGEGSTVAAGAVVTCNVPASVVVAGNPARVVRSLTGIHEEQNAEPDEPRDSGVDVGRQESWEILGSR